MFPNYAAQRQIEKKLIGRLISSPTLHVSSGSNNLNRILAPVGDFSISKHNYDEFVEE